MRTMILGLILALSLQAADTPTEVDAKSPITGKCQCGKVAYAVTGNISKFSPCDCRDCQRATGALEVSYAVVKGDGITITSGEPKTYQASAGVKCAKHGHWRFCGDCGTIIFWVANQGKQTDILAGTLDDPSLAKPRNK